MVALGGNLECTRVIYVTLVLLCQKKQVFRAHFAATFRDGPRSRVARCLPLLRSGLHHRCRHFIRHVFHDRGLRSLLPSDRFKRALPLWRD
jgi:hypothetical protein